MAFNAKEFYEKWLTEPGVEAIQELRKNELLLLAQQLGIDAKQAQRKATIRHLITDQLREKGLIPEGVHIGSPKLSKSNDDEDVKSEWDYKFAVMKMEHERSMRELEIQREEREHEREMMMKEFEMKQEERAEREKREQEEREHERAKVMKELELSVRLEHDERERRDKERAEREGRDVSKIARMVPQFDEEDPEQYFLHFEKLAEQCKWPHDLWAVLIQGNLTGRAREVYTSLGKQDSLDYELVKATVLSAYELIPEAYRQKFRKLRRVEGQTYVEFARQKETLFDRWCRARNIDTLAKLRDLILIEEFKKSTSVELRVFLDERNPENLIQAARMADEYAITHRSPKVKRKLSWQEKRSSTTSSGPRSNSPRSRSSYPNHPNNVQEEVKVTHSEVKPVRPARKLCTYCKKPGHLVDECWKLIGKPHALLLRQKNSDSFSPFITDGQVLSSDREVARKVKVLRDTGASQSLLLEGVIPPEKLENTGESVLIRCLNGYRNYPLCRVNVESDLVSALATLAVVETMPIDGVSLLLGNDLAGGKVFPSPLMTANAVGRPSDDETYPECILTRSSTRRGTRRLSDGLADTFMQDIDEVRVATAGEEPVVTPEVGEKGVDPTAKTKAELPPELGVRDLKAEQRKDPEIRKLFDIALSQEDINKEPVGYYERDGVLMRKYRPPYVPASDSWKVLDQVVIPACYRQDILGLAHDHPLAGHLGISKTTDRILQHFFWPSIRKDVKKYCETCHVCQTVGKPGKGIPKAPLKPIPAFQEPFSKILVDCVGPLPKTKSGNEYLLTIMCTSTRYPEAIPLRNITSKTVTKALVNFFSHFGLPQEIQSDQGTNFMSGIFQQVMKELGIEHTISSAYHPESQGALERFHQTLKNMLRCYCTDSGKNWDEGVPLVLFGAREVIQESLGFSPFELVYGHVVRGPLLLCKEKMLGEMKGPQNLLQYVSDFKDRLYKACQVAREHLKQSQKDMKTWFDKKARSRSFRPGERVLVLWPGIGGTMQARYQGPYVVERKLSDTNYVIQTPDRRKPRQLCHINMLRLYKDRGVEGQVPDDNYVNITVPEGLEEKVDDIDVTDEEIGIHVKLQNSQILNNLDSKLGHLTAEQQRDLVNLTKEYAGLFPDVPGRTGLIEHDVDVGDNKPIKQKAYRVNPIKAEKLKDEVKFMLKNEMIEPSYSDWSSPCLLAPKADGSLRFCTDFRKVNKVTKADAYPMPRIDDMVDRVGEAKFVSKFDLLKGYWQVPLTERAVEISAFIVPDGFYQYRVMPFGMKNSGATFQRLMDKVIFELEGCDVYVDDIIITSDTWDEHVRRIRALFDRLIKAGLSVNLAKCEFGKATVTFLGHIVGQGQLKPLEAKIEAVQNFPVPTSRKEVRRFVGMAGYYRRFCKNFADVAYPLTDLLGKSKKFMWTDLCQKAFDDVKAILTSRPVLTAPDYHKQFILSVDASDVGIGAVLAQNDGHEMLRPVSYFSKKLLKYQKNYSTVEKECLAIVTALQHFDVYLNTTVHPIIVWSDHNPLVFLPKMKNHNQRLLRWSLILQKYNIEIKHIPGRENVVADALSRQ